MNRLQAAKRIGGRLDVELPDGKFAHFDYSYLTHGHERGIYYATSGHEVGEGHTDWSGWKLVGWKEVLRFIREHFPRRVAGQCNHIYDCWSGELHECHYYVARCTCTQEHFHCAACGQVEIHVGVYRNLCGACTKKSDAKRRALTNEILNYEGEFGIPFKEIQEYRDQFEGVYDYESRSGHSDREDFHADG